MTSSRETGASVLEAVRIHSDRLTVAADGVLHIDGWDAAALLDRFGSPLFVTIEQTLRRNYQRIRRAFTDRWAAPVNIMYSIKANNTLAIRAILSTEGAGGDCFGLGELQATLAGGTDPRRVAMNGSNKSAEEIDAAVSGGITINVDSEDELGFLEDSCRRQRCRAPVNLRLKVLPPELDRYVNELHKTADGYVANIRRAKWGFAPEAAGPLVEALRRLTSVELTGYSCHIGHLSKHPEAFAAVAASLADAVGVLAEQTGFHPAILDLGGGWAPERDPSFREAELNPHTIEDYAQATVNALRSRLPDRQPLPELWIEPGRYIVSNAVVLLTRIGAVKRDAGHCWMHVDASTNDLPRIESGRFHYTILPANRMQEPTDAVVEVVGSTCFRSVLGAGRKLPALGRGDMLAILDAGMYAEVFSNQFNGVPRPATILLSEQGADIVKHRETVADIFRHHSVPDWLSRKAPRNMPGRSGPTGSP